MDFKNYMQLALSVIICELAGSTSAIFTTPAIGGWYAGLIKPFFNPPNWLFAPVWTLLFLLMGVALFLVWRKGSAKAALRVFALQLALNVLWTVIFFGLHQPLAAFAEIILLWLAIAWTMVAFGKSSRASVYLLWPYILWVTFAAILNFAIVLLN